jgi:hypothetical protein
MKKLFKNWKTTFFGFATIIGGVAAILKGDLVTGISTLGAGLGLTAAKDFDKTGL